jgi:ADP-ribose pyrophosphatase
MSDIVRSFKARDGGPCDGPPSRGDNSRLTIVECHVRVRERWFPREYVQVGDVAAVLAIDQSNRAIFVEQYRPALGGTILELPAGGCERGENPEAAARRELAEETGCRAQALHLMAAFNPVPGLADEKTYVYFTQNVTEGSACLDDGEEVRVVRMAIDECYHALHSGRIIDGKTVIGLMKFFNLGLK